MTELTVLIQILLVGNSMAFLFSIVPAVVNLRYYIQFKSVDNLLISTFFINWGLIVFLRALEANNAGNFNSYFLSHFPGALAILSLFCVGVRIKWTYFPLPILMLFIPYVFNFILVFTPLKKIIIDGYTFDIFYFSILEIFTYLFVVYAIVSSTVPLSINRVQLVKFMWIIGLGLHSFAHIYLLVNRHLLHLQLTLFTFLMGLLPQYAAVLLFFTLHTFFPEAMFITEEQLSRSKALYQRVLNSRTLHPKIEQSSLLEYLKVASDAMKTQPLSQSLQTSSS